MASGNGGADVERQPLLAGGINAEPGNGPSPSESVATKVIRKGKRLVSLDATRGFTVCVMIFVDETGEVLKGRVNHSPW